VFGRATTGMAAKLDVDCHLTQQSSECVLLDRILANRYLYPAGKGLAASLT
jgi:hypothetical protein